MHVPYLAQRQRRISSCTDPDWIETESPSVFLCIPIGHGNTSSACTLLFTSKMRREVSTTEFIPQPCPPWLQLSSHLHSADALMQLSSGEYGGRSLLKDSRPNICPTPSPTHVPFKPRCYATGQFALVHYLNAPIDTLHALMCFRSTVRLGVVARHGCCRKEFASVAIPESFPPTSCAIADIDPFPPVDSARGEAWGPLELCCP